MWLLIIEEISYHRQVKNLNTWLIVLVLFLQAQYLSPRNLTASGILAMLDEWQTENTSARLKPSLRAFSDHIFGMTGGHPGLVGLCCVQLTKLILKDGGLSMAKWSRFCATRMPMTVSMMGIYERILCGVDGLSQDSQMLLKQVLAHQLNLKLIVIPKANCIFAQITRLS